MSGITRSSWKLCLQTPLSLSFFLSGPGHRLLVELSPAVRRKIRLQGVEKFGEIDRDVGIRGRGEKGEKSIGEGG